MADKCHWPVWGALAVFRPHWVCPAPGVCALPVYTAQAPGCSPGSGPCVACGSSFRVPHKSADSAGPAFCAFPAEQLRQSGAWGAHSPRCGALYPLRGPSLGFRASRLGAPCDGSGELVSSRDPPGGCWPPRISGSLWLETGSLFTVWQAMRSLGPSLPPSPPRCLLPPAGDGPVRCWLALLWNCSVLPLFCERADSVFG